MSFYTDYRIVRTIASDIGIDYHNTYNLTQKSLLIPNIGLGISDMGPKISYRKDTLIPQFIPTTLRLGAMLSYRRTLHEQNYLSIDIAYQISKLLIPSTPVFERDSKGNPAKDSNGNYIILKGKDPNVSAMRGMFQSFYDAPNGMSEELHEIINQIGIETRFNKDKNTFIALRAGKYMGYKAEGYPNYATYGMGLCWNKLRLDYSRISDKDNILLDNKWSINIGYQMEL